MIRQKIKYPYIPNKGTPILEREKEMKEVKEEPKELLCPKAGTATSSPDIKTPSPNIINVMLWMKREAYAASTSYRRKLKI
jgi:hypothetical protein